MALTSWPKRRTASAVVAERPACSPAAGRRRPRTRSVNAGTSNARWADPTCRRPKGCAGSLAASREAAPALTAAAVGGSRGRAHWWAARRRWAGRGRAPARPQKPPLLRAGVGRPAGPHGGRGAHCTQADTRRLVEHTQAARERPRRNSATWPRTLGRRGAGVAMRRASGDCLLKTQDPANSEEVAQGLTPAQCR